MSLPNLHDGFPAVRDYLNPTDDTKKKSPKILGDFDVLMAHEQYAGCNDPSGKHMHSA